MCFRKKLTMFVIAGTISLSTTSTVVADDFDVHGRNMTYPSLPQSVGNFIGHLGIEYRGRIFNMLPDYYRRAYGGTSQLKATSIYAYINASPVYWGARNAGSIYEKGTSTRIAETYVYGAKYTYWGGFQSAYKRVKNGRTTYIPGKYRCDTFVASSLRAGGFNVGRVATPRSVFNKIPNRS